MSNRHPQAFEGSQSPAPSIRAIQEANNEASRYPLNVEAYEHLGYENIPYDRYTSREIFDREMDRVWTKTWQWECREENIRQVGDFVVYDIGRSSILVVRSSPAEIKAFYNSCMHRVTKFNHSFSYGFREEIACPYHGWTWNLDGTIREIPNRWDFSHVNDDDAALSEVRVARWAGFVFINMDPEAVPLEEYLGVAVDHFKNWNMADRYTTIHIQKELPCNWKSAMEAFMENYHTRVVHPQLMITSSGASTQYDLFGKHLSRFLAMTAVPDPDFERELTEEEKLDTMLMGDRSLAEGGPEIRDGRTARATMADYLRDHFDKELDVEVGDLTDSEILDTIEYTLFPNMFLFPGLSLPMIYRFRPIGMDPDRCLFDLLYLRPVPRSGEFPASAEPVRIGVDESYADVPGMDPGMGHVYDQDTNNLDLQQQGFHTACKTGGTMGNYQEIRIRHFHQTLDEYLSGD
jgi:phenylpropionate dioxygenase-like ring-hydroxylating dioxygenase large terminal subunit